VANSVSSFEPISNKTYTIGYILDLLCHLPLSSIIDDTIRPPPLFQPRVGKKFDPPTSSLNPPPKEKFRPPHLLLDNSNTVHNNSNREIVSTCMYWGGRVVKKVIPHRGTKPMFIYCLKSFSLCKKRLNASVSCMI